MRRSTGSSRAGPDRSAASAAGRVAVRGLVRPQAVVGDRHQDRDREDGADDAERQRDRELAAVGLVQPHHLQAHEHQDHAEAVLQEDGR